MDRSAGEEGRPATQREAAALGAPSATIGGSSRPAFAMQQRIESAAIEQQEEAERLQPGGCQVLVPSTP